MQVYTFIEWVSAFHPEYFEEGLADKARSWGRAAALGGSLAAGVMGSMGCSDGKCDIPNSSVTSPDAASYLADDGPGDRSWTSPDAASYLSNNQTQAPAPVKVSKYKQAFGPARAQASRLRQQGQMLKQQGRTSGTFVQGKLQP